MAVSWRNLGRRVLGGNFNSDPIRSSGNGDSAVLERLKKRGRSRAEAARSLRMLLRSLEVRQMLSALPVPSIQTRSDVSGGGTGVNQSSPTIVYNPNNPQNLVSVDTSND